MKYLLLSKLFILLFVPALIAQSNYYVHTPEGRKLLTISTKHILIQYKSDIAKSRQANSLLSQEPLLSASKNLSSFKNSQLFSLKAETKVSAVEALLTSLQQKPEIKHVSPELEDEDGNRIFFQDKLLVKLKSLSDTTLLKQHAKEYFLTIEKENEFASNLFHLSVTKKSTKSTLVIANLLHESNLFAYATPDFLQKLIKHNTNDPLVNKQWALNNTGNNLAALDIIGTPDADMDVFEAWEISTGSGITVAVIDDGIDLTHPDLVANLVNGYDATGQGSRGNTAAEDAHGTKAAGVIGAVGNNGIGIAGIAYNCNLMPIRISSSEDGFVNRSQIANSINWAWQQGADVLSNSWSLGGEDFTINEAIRNAATKGRNGLGCLVFFSAGNYNEASVRYPGRFSYSISVGASTMCDERKRSSHNASEVNESVQTDPLGVSCDGEYWWGSSHGLGLDIVAPSPIILTTDNSGEKGNASGDYDIFNGTSAACPNAAGVMALILGVNPNLTYQEARYILESTCDKVGEYDYRSNVVGQPNGSWSFDLGYGRINAYQAVKAAAATLGEENNSANLALYEGIEINPDPAVQNQALEISYNIVNSGNGDFNGTLSADLHNLDGSHIKELVSIPNVFLPSNKRFTNRQIFSIDQLEIEPGDYLIYAWYQPEGGSWDKLPEGNFKNPIRITVIEEINRVFDLALYEGIEINPDPAVQNQALEISYNIVNSGNGDFNGTLSADLHNLDGSHIKELVSIPNVFLPSNKRFTNRQIFSIDQLEVEPGDYLIYAWYQPEGGSWDKLPEGNFKNPIRITVIEEPIRNHRLILYSHIEVNSRPARNKPLDLWYTVANLGNGTFSGTFSLDLHDYYTGDRLINIGTEENRRLGANKYYTNGLNFYYPSLNVPAGNYQIAAWYLPDGGDEWIFLDPGDYNNPIIIYVNNRLQGEESDDDSFSADSANPPAPPIHNSGKNVSLSSDSDVSAENIDLFKVSNFPNPAKYFTNLKIVTGKEATGKITIQNVEGKTIKETLVNLVQGTQTIPIDLSDFIKGLYFYRVDTPHKNTTGKIIVN